jgi:hypothetical protein
VSIGSVVAMLVQLMQELKSDRDVVFSVGTVFIQSFVTIGHLFESCHGRKVSDTMTSCASYANE